MRVCLSIMLLIPWSWGVVPAQDGLNEPDGCCWIHLWEEAAFMGDDYVVSGPGEWPDGSDWDNPINSLEVGSCASVQLWTQENYEGKLAELESGQQVPDFPAGQISSMKMTCD